MESGLGFTVIPFANDFGAEIRGIDFSKPVPADVVEALIKVQDKYAVTVYRKTALKNDTHVAFASQLGKELESNPFFANSTRLGTPYLFDVSNIEPDGSLVKQGSRRWHHAKGNALWHTDSAYSAPRAKYSLLCCHQGAIPGVANTGFADTRRAYEALTEEQKASIEDLVVEHDLWHSRKLGSPAFFTTPTPEERASKPPAYQKLVQTGPDGRKMLYLAAHAKRIMGMSEAESQKLIWQLIDHCAKPEFTFELEWQNAGDLVWWDNRQSMHRATIFETQTHARDVRRATVIDDGPGAMGVSEEERLAADRSATIRLIGDSTLQPQLVYTTALST